MSENETYVDVYLGIDNGVSGSIAAIANTGEVVLFPTPTRKEQSYTKKKAQITRVDFPEILDRLFEIGRLGNVRAFIERPYVNPKGMKATVSALRALEATLIAVEHVGFSYEYVDSKQWQKSLLPKGCKGAELKHASRDVGIRLFPDMKEAIESHKDADSLLIAEWARREGL